MSAKIVVGLDVGTTKICTVVAELNGDGLRVIGIGVSPSAGVRKGAVINIDSTVDSIKKAVKEAESSSGVRIKSAYAGISGGHIRSFDSFGWVGIRGKEVAKSDIDHAVESAGAVYIPLDREVLHVIPAEFVLDGQEGIIDPRGMSGGRLEARVHIITGGASVIRNLLKCCEKAGLEVSELVFGPLASARAVLTKDEYESGVVLVDIGGGTSDVALFKEGSLRHSSVIGVGGAHITNDIAVGLRISIAEAEDLKRKSGAAFAEMVDKAEEMLITQAGGQVRKLPRKYIAEIIQPRCEEMLELIKAEIKKGPGYESAVCGVVITGGCSLLGGFDRLAESVLGMPVRVGLPDKKYGMKTESGSPLYATGVGLVAYDSATEVQQGPEPGLVAGIFGGLKDRLRDMFSFTEYLNLNHKKEGGTLCLKSRK